MEKYSLEKAHQEADQLRKKIESGDASGYGEAESQLEHNKEVEKELQKKLRRFSEAGYIKDLESACAFAQENGAKLEKGELYYLKKILEHYLPVSQIYSTGNKNDLDKFQEIVEKVENAGFCDLEEIYNDPIYIQKAEVAILGILEDYLRFVEEGELFEVDTSGLFFVKEKFGISIEDLEEKYSRQEKSSDRIKKLLIAYLKSGQWSITKKLKLSFGALLPLEDAYSSPEFKEAAKKGVESLIEDGIKFGGGSNFSYVEDNLVEIKSVFNLDFDDTEISGKILQFREFIFTEFSKNQVLANDFIEELPNYHSSSWVSQYIFKALQYASGTRTFLKVAKENSELWKNEIWFKKAVEYAVTRTLEGDVDILIQGKFDEFDDLVEGLLGQEEIRRVVLQDVENNLILLNNQLFFDSLESIIKRFNLPINLSEYELNQNLKVLAEIFGAKTIEQLYKLRANNYKLDVFIVNTFDQEVHLEKADFEVLDTLPITYIEGEMIKAAGLNLVETNDELGYKELFEKLKQTKDWGDIHNVSSPFGAGAEVFGYELMFKYLNRKDLSRHDGLHAFPKIMELYQTSGLKPNQFYGNILKQVSMDDKYYDAGTAHHYLNQLGQTLNVDFASVLSKAREYSEIKMLDELVQTFNSPKKIFESWNNLKRYADLVQILERTNILDSLKELKGTGQDDLYRYVETLAFHPSSKVDMQAVMQFWREPESFLAASDSHTPEEIHSRKKPSNYIEIPNLDLTGVELRDALVEGDMDTLQVFRSMEISYKMLIKGKEQTFIAKINRKSDPDGVLAGNDTACCMPFGEGKNTVYTFNPNTSLFTLQIVRPDRTKRTIAQSVLTKDVDIKLTVPEVIAKMSQVGEHLTDIVSDDILNKSSAYLACDNVEVAHNFQQDEYTRIIEILYRDFFNEYMKRFGEAQGFITDKVIIGQGYSDTLTHLPQAPNTYVPMAPVGYSDKTGPNIFVLDLKKNAEDLQKTVTAPEMLPRQQTLIDVKGVNYLTFEDTLPVAYLEGKAYADNQSLLVYLHNIENGLIAKDINNAAKARPNMSLKYSDSKGDIKGYLVAYEGNLTQESSYDDSGYESNEGQTSQPAVYISDLATDRKSRTAGGRMIQAFTELYKKNYLEQGKLIPIYVQARETTSYRIIQRQLQKIGKSLGVTFELEELQTYPQGQDTMHPIIIRPVPVRA